MNPSKRAAEGPPGDGPPNKKNASSEINLVDDSRPHEAQNCSSVKIPYEHYREAVSQSHQHLQKLTEILQSSNNKFFWSEERQRGWIEEVSVQLKRSFPETHIGVLGSTGAGKSSLLNALLDDPILPTSGSRACTAAPVQIRYNKELRNANDDTYIYKAEIEMIPLQAWKTELDALLDDCCGGDDHVIEAREKQHGDRGASWEKIDQVYGRGTMAQYVGRSKDDAYDVLSQDPRLIQLLTAGTVQIKEGPLTAVEVMMLLGPPENWSEELEEMREEACKIFKNKVEAFVYRSPGKDGEPQNWPLVQRATLHGPWDVLSTGACLEDLPGVQDAVQARAKVAQDCIQKCEQIWIVASIKRAVDDGTAKTLLGEQFKRLLLMDGLYGKVSFICTQTDNCQPEEIFRDHVDVVRKVKGRWERWVELQSQIDTARKELKRLPDEKRKLERRIKKYNQAVRNQEKDIKSYVTKGIQILPGIDTARNGSINGNGDSEQVLQNLKKSLQDAKKALEEGKRELARNEADLRKVDETLRHSHSALKALAALVRNEYCTDRLQADFRAGLKELTCRGDKGLGSSNADHSTNPIDSVLGTSKIDVFCVSSTDYMKISRGHQMPETFADIDDTQIPSLRAWVHQFTNISCQTFAADVVEKTNNLMDRVIVCVDSYEGNSGSRFQEAFERTMKDFYSKLASVANAFDQNMKSTVETILHPSLRNGAAKAEVAAVGTVLSWGPRSYQKRSALDENIPNSNRNLCWITFNAVLKRNGEFFSSGNAGEINFNIDLHNPMVSEYSIPWQQTMDAAMKRHLADAEAEVKQCFAAASDGLFEAFSDAGMSQSVLEPISRAANNFCVSAIRDTFRGLNIDATRTQRELSRIPLQIVENRMIPGYDEARRVSRMYAGVFTRMIEALRNYTETSGTTMFQEASSTLLTEIDGLVTRLSSSVALIGQDIQNRLAGVYSVCWDNETGEDIMGPKMKEIRSNNKQLLGDLRCLRQAQMQSGEFIFSECL